LIDGAVAERRAEKFAAANASDGGAFARSAGSLVGAE
jgi:hypothetical protein